MLSLERAFPPLCILLLAVACAAPGKLPAKERNAGTKPMVSSVVSRLQGTSVEGRSIPCWVFGIGPEVCLVLGGIHGNESAGAVLARALCSFLEDQPDLLKGRRVVVVPAANPDGLARNQRGNARGVDVNRNFAASNRQSKERYGRTPLSEPESRFIAALIEQYSPARILSLHQPVACVDWDGPARDLAEAVSRACGLPTRKLGARPGSLGSYAGVELGIPIITLELPGRATGQSEEALWEKYGETLLEFIQYSRPLPLRITGPSPVNGFHSFYSPAFRR